MFLRMIIFLTDIPFIFITPIYLLGSHIQEVFRPIKPIFCLKNILSSYFAAGKGKRIPKS
jgi:hypothetical protein